MRDPEELIRLAAAMERPRERYLKFKQVSERYDKGKHSAFAKIFLKMDDSTVEARKQAVYASEEYEAYLDEWDRAEKEKIKAQVEYENLLSNFEALQSALSYDRAAMKHING